MWIFSYRAKSRRDPRSKVGRVRLGIVGENEANAAQHHGGPRSGHGRFGGDGSRQRVNRLVAQRALTQGGGLESIGGALANGAVGVVQREDQPRGDPAGVFLQRRRLLSEGWLRQPQHEPTSENAIHHKSPRVLPRLLLFITSVPRDRPTAVYNARFRRF